ncbi:MAG: DUF2452 domain-containing protein [Lewinellaceae bacterium]|nr:DUF2452 domain-containing protein [Saprospiraceae bacterium]MCB9330126.1 DUF2452 domain-containing protein [Lewinellaceae bacterium]
MAKKKKQQQPDAFVNPIDKDKVADLPGLLPYAHHAGSAIIKPEDKGRIRGNAMTAMYDQTDRQMEQLRQQMETLAQQAKSLHERMTVSEVIYQADIPFQPVIHHVYHLYRRKSDGAHLLSMIAPAEWGRRKPFEFLATVRLLGDHTWEVLEQQTAAAT